MVERIKVPFKGGGYSVGLSDHVLDVSPDPPQEGVLLRGHVPDHFDHPTAGECDCQVHVVDECIRRHEG